MTDIIKSIGAGKDYADLQAFFNAAPSNLVSATERWIAQLYGVITVTGTQTLTARTTSPLYNFIIEAAPGQGFKDNAGATTNPLYLDSSKGATIVGNIADLHVLDIQADNTIIRGLQIVGNSATTSRIIVGNAAAIEISGNILHSRATGTQLGVLINSVNGSFKNNLLAMETTAGSAMSTDYSTGFTVTGNTIVAPNGTTGISVVGQSGTNPLLKDNAIFGFASAPGNISASSSNNAIDLSSMAGSSNLVSQVAASQFIGAADYRLKTGSALIGAGVAVSGRTTDILGLTLASPPSIGAVEYIAVDAVLPTMNGSLTSSAITSSSFTLSWPAASDNVAVTGYEYNIGAGWIDAGNVLTKNITGLSSSTMYSTQVRAYDAAGNRAATPLSLSVTTSASSDVTAPTMNGTLASSAITSSGFTLTWIAASDNVAVTGYEFSTNSGSTWTDAGNVLTRAITGLAPSTLYATRVRAYDAAGNRAATPLALDVTTASGADTTLPTLTGSITPSAITASGFTISWPAGADNVAVAGYEYSTNGGSIYSDAGNVLTKAITGLAGGTAYAVRVRAYDAAGNKSTPALATTVTTLVTITQSLPFKNIQGGLQANMACRVSIMDKATDAVVATKTGLTTNGSGVLAPFTVSGPAAGTEYRCMIVITADGAQGLFLATPA